MISVQGKLDLGDWRYAGMLRHPIMRAKLSMFFERHQKKVDLAARVLQEWDMRPRGRKKGGE